MSGLPAEAVALGNSGDREYAYACDWLLSAVHQDRFDLSSLPSEHDLRVELGVSRSVLRRVLSDFAELGFVERRRAKGTYARQPTYRNQIGEARGTPMRDRVEYRVLRAEIVVGNAVARSLFGAAGGRLLRVTRLTGWFGTPVGLWSLYVPDVLAAERTASWWERDVRVIVRELAAGAGPIRGQYSITAIHVDAATAGLLEVTPNSPVLHHDRVFTSATGTVLASFGRVAAMRATVQFEVEVDGCHGVTRDGPAREGGP